MGHRYFLGLSQYGWAVLGRGWVMCGVSGGKEIACDFRGSPTERQRRREHDVETYVTVCGVEHSDGFEGVALTGIYIGIYIGGCDFFDATCNDADPMCPNMLF